MFKGRQRRMKKHLLGLLVSAALAACAPVPTLPQAAARLQPEQTGLVADRVEAAQLAPDWWRQYGDESLNALISKGLQDSPSLAAAKARVARAAANTDRASSESKPTFGIDSQVNSTHYSSNGLFPPPYGGSTWAYGNVEATAGYEWDFFGRHEADLQAALGGTKAAQADAAAARLSLSAQIARSYFGLARVCQQLDLLNTQIKLRSESVALVRQRAQSGLDNRQDLRSAEAPLEELQVQLQDLLAQGQTLRHQLAALTVQPTDALASLSPTLPAVLEWQQEPTLNLLGRRPDVVAARWRVEAATRDVDAVRTRFYPNVQLGASIGYNAFGLSNWLKSNSLQTGFGPSISLPLFDMGNLRGQLKGAAAEQDAAIAAYNGAVLDAVRDAADQYSTLRANRVQEQAQHQLLLNAQNQLSLAESRQQAGLGNRIPVLNARHYLIAQERQALDLKTQSLDAQVNLMRALGGGLDEAAMLK